MTQTKLLIGIGDLHSHYPALESLLKTLDEKYKIFEDGYFLRNGVSLVFTGDYIDRGGSGLQCIEQVMNLTILNPSNCTALPGNHELMALEGLDIAKKILEGNFEKDKLLKTYAHNTIHGMNGGFEAIKTIHKDPEKALREFYQRFSRYGDIGRWLRDLPAGVIEQVYGKKVLFTHAGLSEKIKTDSGLQNYFDLFKKHMALTNYVRKDKYLRNPLVGEKSVFWTREFIEKSKEELEQLTESVGANFFVVGHTPHPEGIQNYHNIAFDIDTGMCHHYGGKPHAIVFKEEGVFSWNAEEKKEELLTKLDCGKEVK